jgi:hypothetical protein
MSQWIGAARTNFFQVIDEAKFREWAAERELSVETKTTGSTTLFGIYSETDDGGWPTQTWPDSENNPIEVDMVAELAAHLVEGQIAVLMEVGHVKCCHLDGTAVAVNHTGARATVELCHIYQLAAETFGIPGDQITDCRN